MTVWKSNSTKKFKIVTFMFLTYLLSWIIWGILYTSSRGIISSEIYNRHLIFFIILGGVMPSVMGIVLTAYFYGIDGLKDVLKRLTTWKVNPVYYVFVIFISAALFYVSLVICNITGTTINVTSTLSPYNILINFFAIVLVGGPLSEEFGWRGFVLPKLQSKLHPLISAIVLGLFWSCWHLPLFFIPGSSQYGFSFGLFVLNVISDSILITWVYNRTHGSLLLTILFHGALNTTSGLILTTYGQFSDWPMSLIIINIAVTTIVTVLVVINMIRKPVNISKSTE